MPRREVAALAQVLLAAAAARAAAAPPGAVHEHGLADLDAVGAVAERRDGAGDLVAERERQLVGHGPGRPVHQVQVGVAEPGAGDPQEDLARARHGLRDVADLGGCCHATSLTAFMRAYAIARPELKSIDLRARLRLQHPAVAADRPIW